MNKALVLEETPYKLSLIRSSKVWQFGKLLTVRILTGWQPTLDVTDLVPDEAQEPVSRHLWRPDAVYTCVETLASSDTDCGPTSITSEITSPVYTSVDTVHSYWPLHTDLFKLFLYFFKWNQIPMKMLFTNIICIILEITRINNKDEFIFVYETMKTWPFYVLILEYFSFL